MHKLQTKTYTLTLLLLTTLLLSACDTNAERIETAKRAWGMIDNGALVIDVRTSKEYAKGHLNDVLNIPYENTAELIKAIGSDKSRPVVLYCRSGGRVGVAQVELAKAGYTNVFNGLGLRDMQAARGE